MPLPDPDQLRQLQAVFTGFLIAVVAAFMMVFATVWVRDPTVLGIIFGAGCALFGVPAAFGIDARRRQNQRSGNGADDDRWSHLP